MGDILESRYVDKFDDIVNNIKDVCFSNEFISEMGEPIVYNEKQKWLFGYIGVKWASFICYEGNKIKYMYTRPEFRGNGYMYSLYDNIPNRKWKVVASNMSYSLFLKKGFSVVKNFKNCHKLELK